MNGSTGLLLATAALLLAAWRVSAFGASRWARQMQGLEAELDAARTPPAPACHDPQELEGLPAPVQRYFRAVLTPWQAIVVAATLHMEGRFNLSATGEQWKPFTSRQRVTPLRAGFLWDARIALLPGLVVRVVDSYIAGRGLLQARVQGLFSVARMEGGGEIARGEFMRFFAEAPWYPTALLPSQGVRWSALDDHSAQATMSDGPHTLTLLFRFGEDGLIDSFRAEARGSLVDKTMVQAPWEGRFSDYRTHGGMTVPFAGEVAWIRPQSRRSYFQGRVTKLEHTFAVPPASTPPH